MHKTLGLVPGSPLVLGAFSQVCAENQEQRAQQSDLQYFEKACCSKVVAYKDGKRRNRGERGGIEPGMSQENNRKDDLRASQEPAGHYHLQPQNHKSKRLCSEKTVPEHHAPEWQWSREVVTQIWFIGIGRL